MKLSLTLFTFFLLTTSISFADDVLPMNISKVVQSFGCGVPPPNGQPCSAAVETDLVVSVPGKQGCHHATDFTIAVVQTSTDQEFTVYSKTVNCPVSSWPPEYDTLSISTSDLLRDKPIHMMNPLAVLSFPRP